MKRANPVVAVLLLLTSACGDGDRTSCAIAQEAIAQCEAETVATRPFGSLDYHGLPLVIDDDCSGWNACDAACVEHTSCWAMNQAFGTGGSDPNRAPSQAPGLFMQCLMRCYDRFHDAQME